MLPVQQISFTSTYRIPLSEHGVTPNKKRALIAFVNDNYPDHNLHRNNGLGWVRISVRKKADKRIEQALDDMGFKIYQRFDVHNLPKNKMNGYIKNALRLGQYEQIGKAKSKVHPKAKFDLKRMLKEEPNESLKGKILKLA